MNGEQTSRLLPAGVPPDGGFCEEFVSVIEKLPLGEDAHR